MIAKRLILAGALAIGVGAPQTAHAQDPSVYDLLHSSYALWGMMDAMANFCWEFSGFEVTYMESHQAWLERSVFVRQELDYVLETAGVDAAARSGGEQAGADGIRDLMVQAQNPAEACQTWLAAAQGHTADFEPEVFIAYQLGILRERDGM